MQLFVLDRRIVRREAIRVADKSADHLIVAERGVVHALEADRALG
jgi:hypothetical protein